MLKLVEGNLSSYDFEHLFGDGNIPPTEIMIRLSVGADIPVAKLLFHKNFFKDLPEAKYIFK